MLGLIESISYQDDPDFPCHVAIHDSLSDLSKKYLKSRSVHQCEFAERMYDFRTVVTVWYRDIHELMRIEVPCAFREWSVRDNFTEGTF